MSEIDSKARDLFLQALDLQPDQIASFLDDACGDPQLRQRVQKLIDAHNEAGGFLAPSHMEETSIGAEKDFALDEVAPAVEATHVPEVSMAEGTVIADRYTLRERLGEGGMGEVWVAKQSEPVKRRVALKLIKTGMDSRAMLSRFEQERQALAMMDHPNIARVLDGGLTPNGQPFFVMELVNGLPLTQFCDGAKLSLQQRLELFVPICQAVQHAHQKGIVHRDLKPANILVTMIDGRPVPKIIDFGVAKALSGSLSDETLTQFGAVVGTLEYMSPEQASFSGTDVDTRADIYSLGVILYELLTGLKPIDKVRLKDAALNEMIRIIREEEPSKPSTRLSTDDSAPSMAALRQTEPQKLMALLRGELDWVVMKCLEKDRDRRYETANALLRDLQRYLLDEPVEARPPSASYRLRKFLKRNKAPAIAGSLLIVTLLAGIAGTTWGVVEANRQTKIAENETHQKDHALKAETLARQRAQQQTNIAIEARERESHARNDAETSLADLSTFMGLNSSDSGEHSRALIWFRHALTHSEHDEDRSTANWIRVQDQLSKVAVPVQAFSRIGHEPVALVVSDNGRFLAVRFKNGEAVLWDLEAEQQVSLPNIEGKVSSIALSPAGDRIAIGTESGHTNTHIIGTRELKQIKKLEYDWPISSLQFSGDGKLLAIGSDTLRIWDSESRKYRGEPIDHPSLIYGIQFDHSSDRIITSCQDGFARVFQFTEEEINGPVIPPVKHEVTTNILRSRKVDALPLNDSMLLVRSSNYTVDIIDMNSGDSRFDIDLQSRASESDLELRASVLSYGASPQKDHIVICMDSQMQIWDVQQQSRVMEPIIHATDIAVRNATFLDDNRTVLSAGHDRWTKSWTTNHDQTGHRIIRHLSEPVAVAYSPTHRHLIVAEEEGLVRVFKLPEESRVRTLPVDMSHDEYQIVLDRAKEHYVLTGSRFWLGTSYFKVRSLATGRALSETIEGEEFVNSADFSPDGNQLLLTMAKDDPSVSSQFPSSVNDLPGTVQLIDWKTTEPSIPAIPTPCAPLDARFSPDGMHFAVLCRRGEVLVCDSATGEVKHSTKHPGPIVPWWANPYRWVQFAATGKCFATVGFGNKACLWDVQTGQLIAESNHEGLIKRAVFSPSGEFLATASRDKTVQVRTTRDGKLMGSPLVHPTEVATITFARDEKLLLTGCNEIARLWDWRSAQLVCPPFNHRCEITDVAVSPDGRWAMGSGRKAARQLSCWDTITGMRLLTPTPCYNDGDDLLFGRNGDSVIYKGEDGIHILEVFGGNTSINSAELELSVTVESCELIAGEQIAETGVLDLTTVEWIGLWNRRKVER